MPRLSKGLRIPLYIIFGLVSFLMFLYFTFPFDVLKDRLLANVEKGLKGQYELQIDKVSPKLLIGLLLKPVKLFKRGENGSVPMWNADKVRLKTTLFSLIRGNPVIRFDVQSGKGEISGEISDEKNRHIVDMEFEDIDLGTIPFLASEYGLRLSSAINGKASLDINSEQIIRSSGKIDIAPNSIKMVASRVKMGAMGEVDLPDMLIGAGKSQISAEIKNGAIKIDAFKLEGGDMNLDLTGSIYLASDLQNLRLNLRGTFNFSEKMSQALPFLFIIEKQKSADGTFPLTVSGRIARPQIKIGDFTVPL